MAQIDIIIFIVAGVGNFQRDMSASVRTNRLKTGNDNRAHYLLTHCHEIYMQNSFHFLEILGSHSPGKCHIFSLISSVFWTSSRSP